MFNDLWMHTIFSIRPVSFKLIAKYNFECVTHFYAFNHALKVALFGIEGEGKVKKLTTLVRLSSAALRISTCFPLPFLLYIYLIDSANKVGPIVISSWKGDRLHFDNGDGLASQIAGWH